MTNSHPSSLDQQPNLHKDVALVGGALEKLGFTVKIIKDAGYSHIAEVRRAGQDTISFVYYAGHGASDQDARPG